MKLTTIFVFAACLQVSAKGFSQTITYSGKNVPLTTIFNVIEKQTEYNVLYNPLWVDKAKAVTVTAANVPVDAFLRQALKDQPFDFTIENTTIVISRKRNRSFIADEPVIEAPPPIDVHGRVVNDKAEPVEGVTITVKGSNIATFTNANGEFHLKGVDGGATLVFTGVHVETYELALNNRTEIAIHLKPKLMSMEDVAVIANTGYQTISRERATGAFDVVDRKILDKRPVTDISTALQGMVAGLQAKENLDGTMNFLLRGAGSIHASTGPLIVIDGFPVTGNNFSNINPNDVESVTVLKDAAAASVWGSRAANGVIVVTTKRAKGINKVSVEVNAFTRVSNKIDFDQVRSIATSAEHVAFERLAYQREMWSTPYVPSFSPANVTNAITLAQEFLFANRNGFISTAQMNKSLDSLAGVDNRGQLRDHFLRNGLINQFTVNLSGSTQRMKSYGSLLYEGKQDGIVKRGYERYLLNFNNQFDATRYLQFSFGANVQYKKTENSGPSIEEIEMLSPYETLVNPDGSYSVNVKDYSRQEINNLPLDKFPYRDWSYNLLREVRGRDFTAEQLSARVQGGIKLTLAKGIDIDARAQYEKIKDESSSYYNEETFFARNMVNRNVVYNNTTRTVTTQYVPKGGILHSNSGNQESYVLRGQINVNRQVARDINLAAFGGSEISSYLTTGRGYPAVFGYFPDKNQSTIPPYGYGSTADRFTNFLGQTGVTLQGDNLFSWGKDKFASFFSNAALSYRNKYTISGNARSDASNFITHDPKLRWSPLWHVGAMWKLSEEPFMHHLSFVDHLGLRLTYGEQGTALKTSSTRPLVNMGTTPDPYTGFTVATFSDYGNPTLRWERTATTNLGIDFSLLKRKLFGKIDLYNRLGKDITAQIALPALTGTTSQRFNNAEIINKGIELELGADVKIGKLQWNPVATYAYNWNRVNKVFFPNLSVNDLVGFPFSGSSGYVFSSPRQVEGRPIGHVHSYTYLGIKDSIPYIAGPKGVPYSMSNLVNPSGIDFLNYEGTNIPPHTLGWINNFSGFGFDLMVVITGKFGGVYRNPVYDFSMARLSSGLKTSVGRYISDVLANDPRVPGFPKAGDLNYVRWNRFSNVLNTLVESSSFVECKEINLQYTLPSRWIKSLQLSGLRAFAQVRDLGMIWHANEQGFNPEWLPGTQRPVTSYTFGINAKF